jgi:hypothetical protein
MNDQQTTGRPPRRLLLLLSVMIVLSLPFWTSDELVRPIEDSFKFYKQHFPFLERFPFIERHILEMELRVKDAPFIGFIFVILFAWTLALDALRGLYGINDKWVDRLRVFSLFEGEPSTPGQIAFSALASYGLSIWAFGLTYYYLYDVADPKPFYLQQSASFFTWLYFSVVTMATVGYGEIYASTDWTRAVVCCEILMGVAYQVFFFSIVASFVRESSRPPHGGGS